MALFSREPESSFDTSQRKITSWQTPLAFSSSIDTKPTESRIPCRAATIARP
jgi:hypothetical protein